MLLKFLRYRYAKARMSAYIEGTLPPDTRRFVARQIESNPRCYQEYMRLRQLHEQLKAEIPRFAMPDDTQLDTMWAHIQSEIAISKPVATPRRIALRPRFSLGYSVAMLFIVIIMLTPVAHSAAKTVPVPIVERPLPEATEAINTPSAAGITERAANAKTVEIAAQTTNTHAPHTRLPAYNTPEPRTPSS